MTLIIKRLKIYGLAVRFFLEKKRALNQSYVTVTKRTGSVKHNNQQGGELASRGVVAWSKEKERINHGGTAAVPCIKSTS